MEYLNLKKNMGFPHEVQHKIKIVPSKFEYSKEEVYEKYQYTCATYMVGGMARMRIIFEFDIENLFMHFKLKKGNFWRFLVNCFAIFGGLYTFFMITKLFIEDVVVRAIYKRKIGKFD